MLRCNLKASCWSVVTNPAFKETKLTTHKCLHRILKENVFNRTKCFNLPDLLSFLLSEDSNYYKTKLIDVGNNRLNHYLNNLQEKENNISIEQIMEVSDAIFMVQSESDRSNWYMTDMRTGFCECIKGCTKGPCKHKFAIRNVSIIFLHLLQFSFTGFNNVFMGCGLPIKYL